MDSDQYVERLNRYADWGALTLRDRLRQTAAGNTDARRSASCRCFSLAIPDGIPGFQSCIHTAYYSFLKQASGRNFTKLPRLHPVVDRVETGKNLLIFETARVEWSQGGGPGL